MLVTLGILPADKMSALRFPPITERLRAGRPREGHTLFRHDERDDAGRLLHLRNRRDRGIAISTGHG